MHNNLVLTLPCYPELVLRTIKSNDLENLRNWKNTHREAFFHQEIISPEQQQQWYQGYLQRPHDAMFIISYYDQPIGCIGFRKLEDRIDIYNVIMGDQQLSGKGLMRRSLHALVSEAAHQFPGLPVTLKVLKGNPALEWYLKSGFTIESECDTYLNLLFTALKTKGNNS
jgi:RimJ/RimL family protein N-acetyltransferase